MVGDTVRVTVERIERKRVHVRIHAADPRTDALVESALVPGKRQPLGGACYMVLRSTRSGQCSLGFKAPRNIPVHRQEVYDRIAEADA